MTGRQCYHGVKLADKNEMELEEILRVARKIIEAKELSQEAAYELLLPALGGPQVSFV